MNISNEIKSLYVKEGKSQGDVAKMLNTTQANLSKKLKNNSLYFRDVQNIAEALGYELKIEFIKKESQC